MKNFFEPDEQFNATTLAIKSVNGSKCSFNEKIPFIMVFVKVKKECGMAVKWILGNKKGRHRKTPPET